MSTIESATPALKSQKLTGPRIVFLDLATGRVLSAAPDGSYLSAIIQGGQ